MITFRKTLLSMAAIALAAMSFTSCDDANEYADTNTTNPSFSKGDTIIHPASLANSVYQRATGIKRNAMGEEIQGFVESLEFVSADSVVVKMSVGTTNVDTWTDESNTEKEPYYYYTYSEQTGTFEIKKREVDEKGAVSLTTKFMGTAISGTQEFITIVHHGDIPAQTYMVKR